MAASLPRGVRSGWLNLRTAQRRMKRARKADRDAKNDRVTHFKKANDPGAQRRRTAAEQDHADNEASDAEFLRKEGRVYSLPLHMIEEEQEAMDAIRELDEWPQAEKDVVRLLKRVWINYEVVEE